MQSKAEQLEHIDSIELPTTSDAEHLAQLQYELAPASASQYNDCLGTRSKASIFLFLVSQIHSANAVKKTFCFKKKGSPDRFFRYYLRGLRMLTRVKPTN